MRAIGIFRILSVAAAMLIPAATCCSSELTEDENTAQVVLWKVDNLENIGGYEVTLVGSPEVIEDGDIRAVAFDGEGDGLYVAGNPLAGCEAFTVEAWFRPDRGGQFEQRFFHVQEEGTPNRMLLETRAVEDAQWYLDTFVLRGDERLVLIDPNNLHALGQWHHVAAVYDGEELSHYVNGVRELSGKVELVPLQESTTSLGMRHNQVSWFKGAIAWVRVTPRALAPEEFTKTPACKN